MHRATRKRKDPESEGKSERCEARGIALSDNPLVQSSCVHPIVYCTVHLRSASHA